MPLPTELYDAFARSGDTSQDTLRAPYDYERQNESANWLADLFGVGPVMRGATRGEPVGESGIADLLASILPAGKAEAAGLGILAAIGKRGKGGGWGSRFHGAEFGKKRTGSLEDWAKLGEHQGQVHNADFGVMEPQSVYENRLTGDRIIVDSTGRVNFHWSKRDMDRDRQLMEEIRARRESGQE